MLSRVADRIYWMSRYLERAENTARLLSVYSGLLLDLPADAGLDWSVPLEILGLGEGNAPTGSQEPGLEYLLNGRDNHASLLQSVQQARENARTTRDVMPSEAWQAMNEMYLFVERNLPAVAHRPGSDVPTEIIRRSHEITGIIEGGMSHVSAYQFVRLGRMLERADMTSRMIDVAAATMLTGREELRHYDNTIWRAVLRALTAYQMYRQHVRRRIIGEDVVAFLLLNPDFPRSVMHCVSQLNRAAAFLPRSVAAREEIAVLRYELAAVDLEALNYQQVHRLVDDLQVELAALNNTIFETWLNPVRAA
jgi:uncharacterized alpha-E superfamily protein